MATLQAGMTHVSRCRLVIDRVERNVSMTSTRTVILPAGTRPGFCASDLMAIEAELGYTLHAKFHTLHGKGVDPRRCG